jgi:hypothetical protein
VGRDGRLVTCAGKGGISVPKKIHPSKLKEEKKTAEKDAKKETRREV